MLIDISDIKKILGFSRELTCSQSLEIDQIKLLAPVEISIKLTNAGSRILVEGFVNIKIALKCSRCNEEFGWKNKIDINEEFLESSSEEVLSKKDMKLEDLNIFTYKNNTIDLKEIIRQNIITNLPLNPICKSNCLGLCQVCGVNKNEEKCIC